MVRGSYSSATVVRILGSLNRSLVRSRRVVELLFSMKRRSTWVQILKKTGQVPKFL